MNNTPHFIPSSSLLLSMIAAAEAKCDADIAQSKLKEEARQEARALRMWNAEIKQRRYRVD